MAYSIQHPMADPNKYTPQLLPLLTIPRILKLDGAPGCQPPVVVRHALDSPRVESRVDVLAVAASVVVENFLPVVCDLPTLTIQKWPIPCT